MAGYLRPYAGIRLLTGPDQADADVAVVCCDRLTPDVVATMRRCAARRTATVLLVNEMTEAELLVALECRVVEILPRSAVEPELLSRSVMAAAGGNGVMPARLCDELLKHIERVQQETLLPRGLGAALSPREIDVLRLMADGLNTHEVAAELCYSQRTVKNVIYDLTHRLQLRNRSHAVAYALRAGII
ncbi:LuxR C-terminal-related transcriptional regulator [Actinoplanes sp. NPDC051475]|uniref:helix-turn-helix transcriptional regulator n=1 Tax=Actinoplanes sp. NPDC051475 TaxID=3157225 RepID=UPI0034500621